MLGVRYENIERIDRSVDQIRSLDTIDLHTMTTHVHNIFLSIHQSYHSRLWIFSCRFRKKTRREVRHTKTVEVLLDYGVPADLTSRDGRHCLDMTRNQGTVDLITSRMNGAEL
jgi:hypothetical protein